MSEIKGVVAAGHEASAKAGRQILEAGGNAVDAAIAAKFAACVAEPLLTSLSAGGFMLVHDAKSGKQVLFDFFVAVPGLGLSKSGRQTSELIETPVDFEGKGRKEDIQLFHGGHASVGVPGFVAGLEAAHKKFGRLPFKDLVVPAQKIAKEGVMVTYIQAYLTNILGRVVAVSPECKKIFSGSSGELLKEGELLYNPDIVGTLGEIALHGSKSLYEGDLARALLAEMKKGGGYITAEDLAAYKVFKRQPKIISYRDDLLVTNPPPSAGGTLIAHTMGLLEKKDVRSLGFGSPEYVVELINALSETAKAREDLLDDSLVEEDVLEDRAADTLDHEQKNKSPFGNTTHISVIDAEGNAVSTTTSNGSGSGIVIPGTGIPLNNMCGEEDLNPEGPHQHKPGVRFKSMMAPTIIMEEQKPKLALGSAGSNRIRSAIVQVTGNVQDFEKDIKSAIDAPRVHTEGHDGVVYVEDGNSNEAAQALQEAGYRVVKRGYNLFFGGVQAVERDPKTGELSGAGDPRRGGVAVIAK